MDDVGDSGGPLRKWAAFAPNGPTSLKRLAGVGVVVSLLLAGCASTCRSGRTGGWLSSWGSGGGSAFLVGLHRTWGECADRTPGPSQRPSNPPPTPSAEPASELPTAPSGSSAPR